LTFNLKTDVQVTSDMNNLLVSFVQIVSFFSYVHGRRHTDRRTYDGAMQSMMRRLRLRPPGSWDLRILPKQEAKLSLG